MDRFSNKLQQTRCSVRYLRSATRVVECEQLCVTTKTVYVKMCTHKQDVLVTGHVQKHMLVNIASEKSCE